MWFLKFIGIAILASLLVYFILRLFGIRDAGGAADSGIDIASSLTDSDDGDSSDD